MGEPFRASDSGVLSHYLFTSAKNRCLTYLSREALRSNRLSDLRVDVAEPFGVPDIYQLEELRQNIRRAVEELPEPYREAFEMNRFENRTYKEIAEELGISAKTVDYRIQQSLKILRVKLKDYLPLILFLQAAACSVPTTGSGCNLSGERSCAACSVSVYLPAGRLTHIGWGQVNPYLLKIL